MTDPERIQQIVESAAAEAREIAMEQYWLGREHALTAMDTTLASLMDHGLTPSAAELIDYVRALDASARAAHEAATTVRAVPNTEEG